ncbi:MAG: DUF1854 domain-containing protein [Planctomycetota bacterium]
MERAPVFTERSVTGDRVKIWENDLKQFCVRIDDQEFTDQVPRRAFPLSGKADYVCLLNKEGKETVMLTEPHRLDRASREVLEHTLARMYYAATILRVDSVVEKMGVSRWEALTDRGYARFEVIDTESIRKLKGGRVVMTDADGNRFEIRNVEELDPASRDRVYAEI